MKIIRILIVVLLLSFSTHPLHAAYEGEDVPPDEGGRGGEYVEDKEGGWFIGTEQGVLFFVGDSSDLVNLQYYGTVFGGYNFNGYVQPFLEIGQAIGSLGGPFNPTTFFFIMEGGVAFTPLRTKVRPYFQATAGFYILSFDDFFATFVNDEINFTFSGGGGLQVVFGHSNLLIGGAYRGLVNSITYLNGVEITLGYAFQF